MRVIHTMHFGGTTIRIIDPCTKTGWPTMLMEVHNDKLDYTFEFTTEMMIELRHALRSACRITRARSR